MKNVATTLRNAYDTFGARLAVLMSSMAAMFAMAVKPAHAISSTDLTQNSANGKNLNTVAGNLDSSAQTMATLIISFVTIGGFVVVAISLYQMYKASKDEREKPMSAIVGLFIGGAMAGVGTIMWIMRNTIIGA